MGSWSVDFPNLFPPSSPKVPGFVTLSQDTHLEPIDARAADGTTQGGIGGH